MAHRYSWFAIALIGACGLCSLTSQLQAAPAKEVKVPEPNKEERQLVQNVLRGRQPDSPQARDAVKKAVTYEMARLTLAKELPNYGAIRQVILATYVLNSKPETQGIHDYAVRQIASICQLLANDAEYSPQTRINAVALLAELDDVSVSGNLPPRPSMHARNPLFAIANNDNAPSYLRAVALHGLQRQMAVWWNLPSQWKSEVPAEWSQDFKRELGSLLVKIVNSQPQTPLEASAHQWMVRRAYDCLATIQNPAVVPSAINVLLDAQAPVAMRLTAAQYLSQIDASKLNDAQKADYLVGVAHLLRSGLVSWYEVEDDKIKRVTGATMTGAYGGYGGYGMGGGYGTEGYGSSSGSYGAGYGTEGGYGTMGMGYGMSAGAANRPKPKDTQTWDALLARRKANQIAQVVHLCLNAIPAPEASKPPVIGVPLADAQLPAELQSKLVELVEAVEVFQSAINDPTPVTDVNSLLNVAELPIEDIMELVLEIPGFSEKYPDLVAGDELDTVQRAAPTPPAGDGQGSDEGAGDGADPEAGTADGAANAGNGQ
ncbi:MAG: hypothetical protein KatS3mg111_2722 [Pirellulaceae bacterium]|nr:MAG: hypothetical protein KatS3mg111_2722 [Pirellulaceae bacterium]